MPRPNSRRTIASEAHLAERITHERAKQGWSYAGLAQRMANAGCAIDQSAIYKMEKAKPRRRITVDELVALAEVFGISVGDLLVPNGLQADHEAVHLYERVLGARRARDAADDALTAAQSALDDHFAAWPDSRQALEDLGYTVDGVHARGLTAEEEVQQHGQHQAT